MNHATDLTIRVSKVSIAVNLLLTAAKLAAGVVGRSGAMVADAVHSASDVLGSFIVIVGARLSSKKADREHPYGHERLECVASLVLAGILFSVGAGIGYSGLAAILSADRSALTPPGRIALIAAAVSIAVKEALYWYTRRAAKKINSVSLMAEAWHHRSDALSSVGSFAGILGARLGFPLLDPVAGVVICLFIFKVAVDIIRESFDKLLDRACDTAMQAAIVALIESQEGVLCVDDVKTRQFGARSYVDIEISTDGGQTLWVAHDIAQAVHDAVELNFKEVKHCMVHVNPKRLSPEQGK